MIRHIFEEIASGINIREAKGKCHEGDGVSGRIKTRTDHFLTYISNVMDVLDRNNMKGKYL